MTTHKDPAAEAARHGLATKLGVGGTGALVTAAIVDAVTTGKVDSDTRAALISAVALTVVTMLGKYGQAIAAIVSDAIARRLAGALDPTADNPLGQHVPPAARR